MEILKIEIRPFIYNDLNDFIEMFCAYFRSDFKYEISDHEAEELCSEIAKQSLFGIIKLDLLIIDEKISGFICYQIDTHKSDWCEREGWGLIREIYIKHTLRGKGLGLKLVSHAEKNLYNKGVERIYLTSNEASGFWSSCGYKKTGKVSSINHEPIYEK